MSRLTNPEQTTLNLEQKEGHGDSWDGQAGWAACQKGKDCSGSGERQASPRAHILRERGTESTVVRGICRASLIFPTLHHPPDLSAMVCHALMGRATVLAAQSPVLPETTQPADFAWLFGCLKM